MTVLLAAAAAVFAALCPLDFAAVEVLCANFVNMGMVNGERLWAGGRHHGTETLQVTAGPRQRRGVRGGTDQQRTGRNQQVSEPAEAGHVLLHSIHKKH